MTSGPMIDYEALAQDAMRGVVRTVLTRVAKDTALPGDHHFYISFDTQAPGIVLSKRLKEKYPQEMTIVLQHRFWDLSVNEDRFEVKLTFDGIPERLVVPFTALKVFFDPSVRYGLQFDEPDLGPETGGSPSDLAGSAAGDAKATTTRSAGPRKSRTPRKPRPEKEQGSPVSTLPPSQPAKPVTDTAPARPQPAPSPAAGRQGDKTPEPATATASADADKPGEEKPATPAAGAQIVSLDSFRKK